MNSRIITNTGIKGKYGNLPWTILLLPVFCPPATADQPPLEFMTHGMRMIPIFRAHGFRYHSHYLLHDRPDLHDPDREPPKSGGYRHFPPAGIR